jgi:anti-sigma-K factor RskA
VNDRSEHSDPNVEYDLGAQSVDEAAEFAEVAALLGRAVPPVDPPPSVRSEILAKLATTPQLPAESENANVRSSADAEHSFRQAGAVGEHPRVSARSRAQSRWFSRPIVLVASAAAAIALIFGGTVVGLSVAHAPATSDQQSTAVARIGAASDAQRATSKIATGGHATLVWSDKLGKSAIVVNGLAAAPAGKTYQLWYLRNGQAVPAGTMDVSHLGSTTHVLAGTMNVGDTVAVTVEPLGGSKHPTTVPIVSIRS